MIGAESLAVNGKRERAAFISSCFPKRIEIPTTLRDQPLAACQTSLRLVDVLRRAGVRVLGDLHGRKVGDLAWQKNCSFKTLHELDSLARHISYGNGKASAKHAKRRETSRGRKSEEGSVSLWRSFASFADRSVLSVPESVSRLRFNELPITLRLANVLRSVGIRSLGDLNGRTPSELLQCKQCGWRTIGEIQQLIERAISGEFDQAQIEGSAAVARLLTLLEQAMSKLPPQEGEFLLGRIEGLTFAEIGRGYGFTRARVHQVVATALEKLKKTYGPRIPRLLELVKQRCMSIPNSESLREQVRSPLTPALLEQWIRKSSCDGGRETAAPWKLSTEAQVRLIAALDRTIPCYVGRSPKLGSEKLDLVGLACALGLGMDPEIPRSPDAWLREMEAALHSDAHVRDVGSVGSATVR